MPHKSKADRRDNIPKQKYRVANWSEYNAGLRQRGDLTVWVSQDMLDLRSALRRRTVGGQRRYSDLAIELCLILGVVFKQPLRQTQGLMRRIAKLLGIEITVPDFSTLSNRGGGLPMPRQPVSRSDKPIHLTVNTTGLAHESPCSASVSPSVQSKIDKLATLIDGSPKIPRQHPIYLTEDCPP